MNNTNEILNELKTLAPTLASIVKQNCFTMPENYFSQGIPKVSAVSHILDGEAAAVDKRDIDLAYLDLMSEILADNFSHLKEVQVFNTPNEYFANLTEDVIAFKNSLLAIENIEEDETLDKSFQTNKYNVPENYFSNLPNSIINKIEQEEVLGQFKNELAFIVPENYFTTLPQNILNKIKTPAKSGRVIKLQTLRNALAIAATLALFVAGAWLLNFGGTNAALSVEDQIALLSTDDIEAYITSNAYEFENQSLTEDLIKENSKDLFWQIDVKENDLDYYLQNIEAYNLNI